MTFVRFDIQTKSTGLLVVSSVAAVAASDAATANAFAFSCMRDAAQPHECVCV